MTGCNHPFSTRHGAGAPPSSNHGAGAPTGGFQIMISNVDRRRAGRTARLALATLLGVTMLGGVAQAQEAAAPSEIAMVNLIRGLVAKGIFNEAEGAAMIAQAEAEAAQARATAQTAAAVPAPAGQGTSVRYVPQFVRDEIKAEVRAEVLAEAKSQGLVAPEAMPGWVRGVKLTGDLRVRGEWRFFDQGNALDFVNVGAINAGAPYDPVNNPNLPPIVNTVQDRALIRLRARLGLEAQINPKLTAYFSIATGNDASPVSTNQTLGGYAGKKDLWLDRAYIDYRPVDGAHVLLGRMKNPFALTELVWDEDINLDGGAISFAALVLADDFSLFATAGAFPLDYVPDDFPAAEFADGKLTSGANDKWLFAGQVGASWASDSVDATLSAAYYHFHAVEGALSPSCFNTAEFCLTDTRRPGFLQKGNTLFGLRDLVSSDPDNQAAPQYFGLASQFRVLAFGASIGVMVDDAVKVTLDGHFTKNLGYDPIASFVRAGGSGAANDLGQIVNNNERCSVPLVGGQCPQGSAIYDSGANAWLARVTVGSPTLRTWGDWQVSGSYRRIAPDALLDAFTDSDFRLGGTNAKGWTLEGSLAVMENTRLGLRWLNGDELSGPPFRVDLLQADLTVGF